MNLFLGALVIQQLIMLAVSIFDRTGTFLKSYPFRTSVLTHLIGWPLLVSFIQVKLKQGGKMNKATRYQSLGQGILLLAVAISITFELANHTIPEFSGKENDHYEELISHVRENTAREALFIALDKPLPLSFMRKTKRNLFVEEKYIPSEKSKIYKWYIRMEKQEKLFKDYHHLKELSKKYDIDYAVSHQQVNMEGLTLVFQQGPYYLYKHGPSIN
jgi:hypothetical protein